MMLTLWTILYGAMKQILMFVKFNTTTCGIIVKLWDILSISAPSGDSKHTVMSESPKLSVLFTLRCDWELAGKYIANMHASMPCTVLLLLSYYYYSVCICMEWKCTYPRPQALPAFNVASWAGETGDEAKFYLLPLMWTRKLTWGSDEKQSILVPCMWLVTLSSTNWDIRGRMPAPEVRMNLNVTVALSLKVSFIDLRTPLPVKGTALEYVIFPWGIVMIHLKLILWFALHVRTSWSPGQTDTTLTCVWELMPT